MSWDTAPPPVTVDQQLLVLVAQRAVRLMVENGASWLDFPGSDDRTDYAYSAASSASTVLGFFRDSDVAGLREHLQEPASDWWASDGDVRFDLADVLSGYGRRAEADAWARYIDS